MSALYVGALCGFVFGIVDVLLMIPIPFPSENGKTLAMTGAFVNCLVIGIVIGASRLPTPGWLSGLVLATLITLPTAIITESYIPILIVSAAGGALIGLAVQRWGH